jgi:hypothetical protein
VSCDNLDQQFLETFIQQEGLNDIFRRNVTEYFNAYAHRLAQLAGSEFSADYRWAKRSTGLREIDVESVSKPDDANTAWRGLSRSVY